MQHFASLILTLTLASCGGGGDAESLSYDDTEPLSYSLKQMAIGEHREIAAQKIKAELVDLSDSRCPIAAICTANGLASVNLSVSIEGAGTKVLTLTSEDSAKGHHEIFSGFEFTLDKLDPHPVTVNAPKADYRADITVRSIS